MKAKSSQQKLKLPDDFLGTVAAMLHVPPPPKAKKAAKKSVKKLKGAKKR
jgi:hypothetical protein